MTGSGNLTSICRRAPVLTTFASPSNNGHWLGKSVATSPKRFRLSHQQTRTEQGKMYDDRRGSAASRGYDNKWDKAAKGFLRSHPLCRGCEAVGVIEAAVLVDHVEPHRGDMVKFWDSSKWQSSCRWHHDVVKQRLEQMWMRGAIDLDALWLDSLAAITMTERLRP